VKGLAAFLIGVLIGALGGAALGVVLAQRSAAAESNEASGGSEELPSLFDELRRRLDHGRVAFTQARQETRERMQRELRTTQGRPT
jgi:hypothetical protein